MAKCGLKTTQYLLLSHVLKLGPIRPGGLATEMKMDAHAHTQPPPAGRCGLGELKAGTRSCLVHITDALYCARKRSAISRATGAE